MRVLSLESWRAEACLSVRDLAKRAEVAPVTIWRIEHARHIPIAVTRRRIAQALGTDHQAIAWPVVRVPAESLPF
jgi:transcriptional regulator with XRE-family HTH domain